MTDYEKLYKEAKEREYWQEYERRQESERQYERREAERREKRQQEEYENVHVAHSWKQAFRKNISRLQQELRESIAFKKADKGDFDGFNHKGNVAFWRNQIRINQLADEYLTEEMERIAPIITKLEAWIEALKRRARQRVIKRIEEVTSDSSAVACLVDDDPSDLLNW